MMFSLDLSCSKLGGHLDRFDPVDGMYKDIPLKDYVVVDFYENGTFNGNVTGNGTKYYASVFNSDFSAIQLWHNVNAVDINCGRV